MNQQFRVPAPNMLWVSDFTYVATWKWFVYVAFVIDIFTNRIVGWKASTTQDTQFALDALEQAIHARRPAEKRIYHSDRGSQSRFNRSSQHPVDGGVDVQNRQTKIRTFDPGRIKLTRKAASLAT
ncbi:DDE-type integrase/transposase/recombinase [Epibacterium sp. DP7N7-1]|nr:DDE-type integrase/transposase/recombinase [Epibacterium sp. DP7N7-1]